MLNFEGKVSVVCQIQTDGSLLCGDVKGAPRKGAFVGVPAELEELWHAAPQLLDGTPSAGRWVQIDLTFKLSPPGHG